MPITDGTSWRYTILEELSAEIGYTATSALVDKLGGSKRYIPKEFSDDDPIVKLIGRPAANRLAAWMDRSSTKGARPSETRYLWIPIAVQRSLDRRDRVIVSMLANKLSIEEICRYTMMSRSYVFEVRKKAEETGLMALVTEELTREKPPKKPPMKPT